MKDPLYSAPLLFLLPLLFLFSGCGDSWMKTSFDAKEEVLEVDQKDHDQALAPRCGDGTIDPGETCDPPESCPLSCEDQDPCTLNVFEGSPIKCNALCLFPKIGACYSGDGCCPEECEESQDADCSPDCQEALCSLADGCCPPLCDADPDCIIPCALQACAHGDGCCPDACSFSADNDCPEDLPCAPQDCGQADGCCPVQCAPEEDPDCATDSCDDAFCGLSDDCCPEYCFAPIDEDCSLPCEISDCGPADGCCPIACAESQDPDCSSSAPCEGASCGPTDGCCPTGCAAQADTDCAIDCTTAAWPAEWATMEEEVVILHNQARAQGVDCPWSWGNDPMGPLTINNELREAARCHSLDMAQHHHLDHDGSDGSSFSTRCDRAGYTGFARYENIARGQVSAADAHESWISSWSGHCDSIMAEDVNEVGIGLVVIEDDSYHYYWTAVFGQR